MEDHQTDDVPELSLRHPKSVITVPEGWTHVVQRAAHDDRNPESEKHTKEQSQVTVISVPDSWRHVVKHVPDDNKHEKNLNGVWNLNKHEKTRLLNGAWSHILEAPCPDQDLAHSVVVMGGSDHNKWTHLLTDEHHQDVPPMDLSGDCGKLTSLMPERRDASCQVDEVASEEAQSQEDSDQKSDNEVGVNQDMLNLMEAQDGTSQVVVHNGIKPELYTQERHLVVQAGTRAQAPTKTATNYPCTHCSKVFGDSRSLQRHMLIHIGLRQYRCPVCNKAFMLNGDLTRHIRIHSGERPYACEICGRRFTLKGNLMQHFRTHTPEKQYACTICEKNYAQKDSLHRHIRAHFGEKPFECTTCNKRFTLKGDLSRHILIHSGVKPHSCKYCGRQFALKGNLTQHVRTHVRSQTKCGDSASNSFEKTQEEPQLICDLSYSNAQKTFSDSASPLKSPSSLVTTSSYSLTTAHPYVQTSSPSDSNPSLGLSFCSECSKTFPSPESLHEHVQLIHEQSTRISSNRYLCNICQKEFTLKGDLTRHLNSHNGVKPYECEHCNKTFTLKSNLRQHLTTHRQDRTFACPMCSKSFGNRRNLNLHLRRHEQARANFTCTRCGRSFLAKSDHFFHDCLVPANNDSLRNDSVPSLDSPTNLVVNGNTPPDSPRDDMCLTPLAIESDPDMPSHSDSASMRQTDSTSIHQTDPTSMRHTDSTAMHHTDSMILVKRESCQLPCDEQEMSESLQNDNPVLTTVNGSQSFLGPFYRHLYFSTSHQSVIPTLKGLLHASSAESNIVDFNRVGKTS